MVEGGTGTDARSRFLIIAGLLLCMILPAFIASTVWAGDPVGTETPTQVPTEAPTEEPTTVPTEEPTTAPTEEATETPTEVSTEEPTSVPTEVPPTEEPTSVPTEVPPTEQPTEVPPVDVDELIAQLVQLLIGIILQILSGPQGG
jgi:hypothetical protein